MRRWLEALAGRWVYGRRLSGAELIQQFGATLQHAFDVQELAPSLAETVRLGFDARWVRVSLYRAEGGEACLQPAAIAGEPDGEPGGATVCLPLVHQGDCLGQLECGPKREGSYDMRDRELLATLARQAALALRNLRLTAEVSARLAAQEQQARELAASRARLVQAEETARRRIERDIHDGVQQQLVALMPRLELARAQLRDPEQADRLLQRLQDEVRLAVADLRELTRGIHPAVLGDRGLVEAIESRVAGLPIGVTIECDPAVESERYGEATEGAAYFLVCEALTNVMKHAHTDRATVRLSRAGGDLRVEVIDQGCGFDASDADRGAPSGLRGLRDRMEALGGSLQVAGAPGCGTHLTGTLPVTSRRDA